MAVGGSMQKSILRLVYPQWQGGDIASWFKELPKAEVSRGYILGAYILNLILESLPTEHHKTAFVEVSKDFREENGERIVEEGIIDKRVLQLQTKRCFEILKGESPAKILTLGGECSASVAPFSYLAKKYANNVALIWIDAHPDIGLPYDDFYKGYHAMAVSALIGKGNLQHSFNLPCVLNPNKVLLVGLHSKEAEHYAQRQRDFGLKGLSAEETSVDRVLEWLGQTGVKKVMIHLDLDVLLASELYVAVGNSGQLKLKQTCDLICQIATHYEVVGLTIAEHLPKLEIELKMFLEQLPLIKN